MDEHQITQAVDTAFAQVAEEYGMGEPDWAPLEAVLPLEECGGFMFMGYYPPGGNREGAIRLYKHGITRHYLNLHPSGQAYRYDAVTGGYRKLDLEQAIAAAFEGLEALGGTRSTVYDEEYRRQRNARLAEAGYTVIQAEQ
jgi:hypothetical protein